MRNCSVVEEILGFFTDGMFKHGCFKLKGQPLVEVLTSAYLLFCVF